MSDHGLAKLASLLLSFAGAVLPALAEVSVQNPGEPELIYIFGKQAGPDPWPSFGVVRGTPLAFVLNPQGDLRGDKRPDIVLQRGFPPAVVWSYWDGADFEIAFSEWDGAAWSVPRLLTDNAADDLDPKIILDAAGRPVITWWRTDATPAVFSTRRTADGLWESETRVSQQGESARTPAIALPPDGHVRIGYEVTGSPERQVVVTRDNRINPEDPPGYVPEIVATTPYTGDTQPIVSMRGTLTWVSWVHSASLVGWSELRNGSWAIPQFEPYNGADDIEAARFRIKNRLQP